MSEPFHLQFLTYSAFSGRVGLQYPSLHCIPLAGLLTSVAKHLLLSSPVGGILLLCGQLRCHVSKILQAIGRALFIFVFLGPQQALNNELSNRVGFQSQDFSFQHKSHISPRYSF